MEPEPDLVKKRKVADETGVESQDLVKTQN
jgi:hypothetical protein